ncbi:MFS transporter [Streptomyces sp. E11-3]|uniref:MFS transporter n=1 Tax=Streptomyces sp. E11-3 TaxID=3110112 RepID=UPI0039815EFE
MTSDRIASESRTSDTLPTRLRLGYASGSLVTGTFTTVPGLLLLPYLTDTLGVGAALAGLIVLLPKLWNVVLNPFVGRLSDHTRTRWGARRPFVLGGGLATAAAFGLMFSGSASGTLGAVCVALGFFLLASAFALFQVPYVAIAAESTTSARARVRLIGGRVAGIAVAALVAGSVAPALVDAGGGGITGHRWAGLFGAVVVTVGALGVFLGTVRTPAQAVAKSEPSLRRQVAVARANRPFMALLRCMTVQVVATGSLLAGAPYFAEHVLGRSEATGLLVAAFVAPNLFTMPWWSRLGRRRGNHAGFVLASWVVAGAAVLLFAAPLLPTAAVLLVMLVVGVGHAGQLLFMYAMLTDCTEHDTVRTGKRQAGVFSGVFSGGETLGLAVAPFLFALVLQLFGYVSSETGTAAAQSGTAKLGVLLGISALPALATLGGLVLLRGYDRSLVGALPAQRSRAGSEPAEPPAPSVPSA